MNFRNSINWLTNPSELKSHPKLYYFTGIVVLVLFGLESPMMYPFLPFLLQALNLYFVSRSIGKPYLTRSLLLTQISVIVFGIIAISPANTIAFNGEFAFFVDTRLTKSLMIYSVGGPVVVMCILSTIFSVIGFFALVDKLKPI